MTQVAEPGSARPEATAPGRVHHWIDGRFVSGTSGREGQVFDPATGQGTGVVFNDYDVGGVTWGVGTALDWYDDKSLWRRLVQNGMQQDFSWDARVGEYEALYDALPAR